MELLKNLRFMTNKINQSELAIIINKAYIVFVSSYKCRCTTPHIGEHKFKRIMRHTKRLRVGQLMALPLLAGIAHSSFIQI